MHLQTWWVQFFWTIMGGHAQIVEARATSMFSVVMFPCVSSCSHHLVSRRAHSYLSKTEHTNTLASCSNIFQINTVRSFGGKSAPMSFYLKQISKPHFFLIFLFHVRRHITSSNRYFYPDRRQRRPQK